MKNELMHEDKNHINVLEDEKLRIFFGEKPLGQSQHKGESVHNPTIGLSNFM